MVWLKVLNCCTWSLGTWIWIVVNKIVNVCFLNCLHRWTSSLGFGSPCHFKPPLLSHYCTILRHVVKHPPHTHRPRSSRRHHGDPAADWCLPGPLADIISKWISSALYSPTANLNIFQKKWIDSADSPNDAQVCTRCDLTPQSKQKRVWWRSGFMEIPRSLHRPCNRSRHSHGFVLDGPWTGALKISKIQTLDWPQKSPG